MALESQKQTWKLFGAEDDKPLLRTSVLVKAYRADGRWGEAEQLQGWVMETRTTKLGLDHKDTLHAMNSLAITYQDQAARIRPTISNCRR